MALISRLVLTGRIKHFVLITILLCPQTAFAVVVDGLFDVEILVPDETRPIRQAAFSDGLAEMLVRVSGDRNIIEKIQPPSPNAYVKQFRYTAIEPASGKPELVKAEDIPRHKLLVQYNGTKIMNLLRKHDIPIWGEHRSEAVIWLAVRDGRNQYILRDQDTSLIKARANEDFQRRGIPVLWPRNDRRDQQQLGFADIWAGFAEPVQQASERYTLGPAVTASMTWNGSTWVGDWSVFMGNESKRWSLTDKDYTVLIALAIDLVADAMAQKYAVLESTDMQGFKQILVEIDQVESVKKFRRVQKYLSSLPVVQSVNLSQVEPERAAFKLTLRSEIDDFLKLINADTQMMPLVTADVEPVNGIASKVYRFKLLN